MIGIDIAIIVTFPPISILEAIADSPESLHILTANSVKKAIPVILINKYKNSVFIEDLFARLLRSVIIPDILPITKLKISTPEASDMYTANSGLCCFIIIIIIKAIKPIPIILSMSIFFLVLRKTSSYFYKLNIVLTVLNNVLISFITIVKTITSPC